MVFETFKRSIHRHPRDTYPYVTVHKGTSPRIHFSYACTVWLAGKNAAYVLFLWDKDSRTMAFKLAEKGPDSYRLTVRKSQAYVSARLFLEHIGKPEPGRYEAVINDKEGMIEVKLTPSSWEDK